MGRLLEAIGIRIKPNVLNTLLSETLLRCNKVLYLYVLHLGHQ